MTTALPTSPTVAFDLNALLRRHKVTIREFKRRTGITLKRIREVRTMDRVDYLLYCDWTEAITGQSVFDREYYDRMYRTK